MGIKAPPDPVLLQNGHDLGGVGPGVDRRVVEKDQLLLPRLGGLQAQPQPADLPVHHLFVVGFVRVEQPPPRPAQSVAVHRIGVVVQQAQGIEPLRPEKCVHLVGGGPPVVVVALHDQFLARQAVQEGEVLPGVGQPHGPADVPRQYHRILRLDQLAPVGFQLFDIAVPAGEHVHGFGAPQRKMGVAQHKQCHVQLLSIMPDSPGPPRRSGTGR